MKKLIYVALFILIQMGFKTVAAQDSLNVSRLGYYDTPGVAYEVAVSGNYAYVADYPSGLWIIDIMNPATPTEVGFYGLASATCVAVSGSYAYVGEFNSSLRIIDITNPAVPTEVGACAISANAWAVAVNGNYAYVAGAGGLRIIDISNPAAPVLVGTVYMPSYAYSVAVRGAFVYVADESSGLRIVDVSDPVAPFEVGVYDTPGYASSVVVSGSYAYVADGFGGSSGLRIIDISNPVDPIEVGFYPAGFAGELVVDGNYAYVVDGHTLRVIDVTIPAAPTEIGFYDNVLGVPRDVELNGAVAYVVFQEPGLVLYDVSHFAPTITLTSPNGGESKYFSDTDTVRWTAQGVTGDVSVDLNRDYPNGTWETLGVVSSDASELDWNVNGPSTNNARIRVVSVDIPAIGDTSNGEFEIVGSLNVTLLGSCEMPYYANTVAVQGDLAYISNWQSGLRVIDISNAANPTEIGFFEIQNQTFSVGVAVRDNYAFLADNNSGLRILDISNSAAPFQSGFFDTPGSAFGIALSGNYAYVADHFSGLRVLDISSPAAPGEVGFTDTPGIAFRVTVSGYYAYVADYTGGLRIIDITNPSTPAEIGSHSAGLAVGVAVSGGYAYVADLSGLLWIFDISNPSNPTYAGALGIGGQARDVAVSGSYLYLANGNSGIRLFDISNPVVPTEVGYYDTPGYAWGVAVRGALVYVADDTNLGVYEFTPCVNAVPTAPQVVLQPEGQSMRLSWTPVTVSEDGCPVNVTHYLVFYSPTSEGEYYYHGFTTDTNYVHAGVIPNAYGMYYQVVATTADVPTVQSLPAGGIESMNNVLSRLAK